MDLFHQVINSARVGSEKRDPRIYQVALETAKASPESCLFVDDRPCDMVLAEELGIQTWVYAGWRDCWIKANDLRMRECLPRCGMKIGACIHGIPCRRLHGIGSVLPWLSRPSLQVSGGLSMCRT